MENNFDHIRFPGRYSPGAAPTSLVELHQALQDAGVPCKYQQHPGYSEQVVELLGESPVGTHQIIVQQGDREWSVIRGMASFGYYEVMQIKGKGEWSDDPVRFSTPGELVKALRTQLRG